MLVGWPDFKVKADQISLLELSPKVFRFLILNQVAINVAVADTTLATKRNVVRVVTGTDPDSD
jgi:hypothetical protein